MDGLLNLSLLTDDGAALAAALAPVGAVAWATSLFVGWATPAALIDRLGRFAIVASTLSVAALGTGLLLVVASVVS